MHSLVEGIWDIDLLVISVLSLSGLKKATNLNFRFQDPLVHLYANKGSSLGGGGIEFTMIFRQIFFGHNLRMIRNHHKVQNCVNV